MTQLKTAAILVIGDEILSGRTHDSNTRDLALKLGKAGITLCEARVIPDIIDTIVATVNALRAQYDYVFTTGGIGPTHDDKTAEAIAKAFGVPLALNQAAYDLLCANYGGADQMNEGRTKMAIVPDGARLIDNPISAAPGFAMENVFVLAGVPKIMNAMADGIIPTLEGGARVFSVSLEYNLPESVLAPHLKAAEDANAGVTIGSYPKFVTGEGPHVTIVLRGCDIAQLERVAGALDATIKNATMPS